VPLPPYTYQTGDYVTPARLNNDYYVYEGVGITGPLSFPPGLYNPNGILFHGRKPVYKAYPRANVSAAAGGWVAPFTTNSTGSGGVTTFAYVTADTAADYGSPMDPGSWGWVNAVVNGENGLADSQGGGWHLVSSFIESTTASGNSIAAALFQYAVTSGGPPAAGGTVQRGAASGGLGTMFIDLVNMPGTSGQPLAPGADNSQSAAITLLGGGDGSGGVTRFQSMWAFPDSGTAPSSIPAIKTSWAPADQVTSAIMNAYGSVLQALYIVPALRVSVDAAQSIPNATNTTLALGSGYPVDTTFAGWNGTTHTYTVQRPGLYLVHAQYTSANSAGSAFNCGVTINGTTYFGPQSQGAAGGFGQITATKTQIFSLNAGDTVLVTVSQFSGAALNTWFTSQAYGDSRLVMLWLSSQGVPSPLPDPPDTTFRWAAGTPPDLSPLLQLHLGQDLTFLTKRPYFMGYQTTAQAMTQSTSTALTLGNNTGIVHGDNGDNYSGWNGTSTYTCVKPGWYLACSEFQMTAATLTTSPVNAALLGVTPHGSNTWDTYQQQYAPTAGNPGATALGLYYLRAGDTIQFGGATYGTASGTLNTSVTAGRQSHGELVWVSS
jgi:hypothetical protein